MRSLCGPHCVFSPSALIFMKLGHLLSMFGCLVNVHLCLMISLYILGVDLAGEQRISPSLSIVQLEVLLLFRILYIVVADFVSSWIVDLVLGMFLCSG